MKKNWLENLKGEKCGGKEEDKVVDKTFELLLTIYYIIKTVLKTTQANKHFFLIILISIMAGLVFVVGSNFSNAAKPSDFGLKEGDLISAIFSDDPDVYIINEHGYKRLFLNPEIFKFYSHLGGFANIKLITPEIRDSFPTSGLFRNCEDNDQKVFGTSVEGEDSGRLHWINKSGDQAVQEDSEFFKKVFCINRKEFNWYPRGNELKALKEVPQYHRSAEAENPVICHHPTDDPKTFQTIRVAPESLDTHFQHRDTKGACSSPLPTPTIKPVPASLITLLSPNGGEKWQVSSAYFVSWRNNGYHKQVGAHLKRKSGSPVLLNGQDSLPLGTFSNTDSFLFAVGTEILSGDDYIIEVIDYNSTAPENTWSRDTSDAPFTIINPSPTMPGIAVPLVSATPVRLASASDSVAKPASPSFTPTPTLTPTPTPTTTPTQTPTVDTTEPNPPSLSVTAVSSSEIKISWSASTDNVGVVGYKIYRKGYLIATVSASTLSYSDTGLSPNTSYPYTVQAYDAAGNNSMMTFVSTQSATTFSATPTPTPATSSVSYDNFSRNLGLGSSGDDVKKLQAALVNEVGYSADLITGYFGRITRDAVKRFQEKYGVKPVSGYFGEVTRRALGALISD